MVEKASESTPVGASATMRPFLDTIALVGNCSSRHQMTSVRSPKVQIMAMPVPLSGCARGWATIGTSTP